MRLTVLTILALLLSAGYASAADTDSGTAGRPSAVLSNSECLAVWHATAGDELRSVPYRQARPLARKCERNRHKLPAIRHRQGWQRLSDRVCAGLQTRICECQCQW